MLMPGVMFREIRDAIVSAYEDAALQETLRFNMNFDNQRAASLQSGYPDRQDP